MPILQLDPPLPLSTPRGRALAHLVIDYGAEHHLMWVCFGDDGEIWTWPNPQVRAESNITMGRQPAKLEDRPPRAPLRYDRKWSSWMT